MTAQQIGDELERPVHNERLILLILAAVQFITIVDFMIVMPLGPQLMRHIGHRSACVWACRVVVHVRRWRCRLDCCRNC